MIFQNHFFFFVNRLVSPDDRLSSLFIAYISVLQNFRGMNVGKLFVLLFFFYYYYFLARKLMDYCIEYGQRSQSDCLAVVFHSVQVFYSIVHLFILFYFLRHLSLKDLALKFSTNIT